MTTAMEIPEGKRLQTRYSYDVPTGFVSCKQIWIKRKPWQFWLPKRAVAYTVLVSK